MLLGCLTRCLLGFMCLNTGQANLVLLALGVEYGDSVAVMDANDAAGNFACKGKGGGAKESNK